MTKDANELLVHGRLRNQLFGRVEVLDRAGELLLLPNTELATSQQLADFYNVDVETIRKVAYRHNNELSSD